MTAYCNVCIASYMDNYSLIICSCCVYWGDGSHDNRDIHQGVPEKCVISHTYTSDKEDYYRIQAKYCNILYMSGEFRSCCSILYKDIFIGK